MYHFFFSLNIFHFFLNRNGIGLKFYNIIHALSLQKYNIQKEYCQQGLSEDNIVCQQQPNLNSNNQLVCMKSKFLSTDDNEDNNNSDNNNASRGYDKSSLNIYVPAN